MKLRISRETCLNSHESVSLIDVSRMINHLPDVELYHKNFENISGTNVT